MALELQIRPISGNDEAAMRLYAEMLRQWLYQPDDDPAEQIAKAERVFAALAGDQPIGFASVNRFASPDDIDDGALWFEDSVVDPQWRGKGASKLLQQERMRYASCNAGRIFTTAVTARRMAYLERCGWAFVRRSRDGKASTPCTVYEYPRARLQC